MAISRYAFTGFARQGKIIASYSNMSAINSAVENGTIECSTLIIEEGQRLDQIAGLAYQNSNYWWVIAAASGIGWALQVPPGTLIKIPNDLNKILEVLT